MVIAPLEAGFGAAIAKAVSGIGSQQAGELVSRLLKKYETQIEQAPLGSRYAECYDLKTQRPRETYVDLYNRVREEIAVWGLKYEGPWGGLRKFVWCESRYTGTKGSASPKELGGLLCDTAASSFIGIFEMTKTWEIKEAVCQIFWISVKGQSPDR